MRKLNLYYCDVWLQVLQQKVEEKTEEYETLSKLFVSQAFCLQHNDSVELLKNRRMPKRRRAKTERHRWVSTNTCTIDVSWGYYYHIHCN